jgi:hypothetical protein
VDWASETGGDWRNAEAYAPLLLADRSLLAWEWLRRDRCYRAAAMGSTDAIAGGRCGEPAGFGLVAFEPPDLGVPDARPLWSSAADPHVLAVEPARGTAPADLIDLRRFAALASVAATGERDHLLLSDGLRTVRLDGPPGTFGVEPVGLRYLIGRAEPTLRTLHRFLRLCRTGAFPAFPPRQDGRARRLALMLRAYDALVSGACQREIAHVLLSASANEPRWRSRESSARSQAQRLVRSARTFAGGRYRSLLR